MLDLSTTYLGLKLKNPLAASASSLSGNLDNLRKMEDAGAAAVVMHSLFEEQIATETNTVRRDDSDNLDESLVNLPDVTWIYRKELASYDRSADVYLEHLHRAKQAVQIPIIASLNGTSGGAWTRYASDMQQAGADALELNTYYLPTDPDATSAEVERVYCDLVKEVKSKIRIPVAVKLSPYFSAMAHMARNLYKSGADALVLFNRFYQPDFDLEKLEVVPNLALSTSQELLLRLHWVAILYGRIQADLAVTGGVHTAQDTLKAVMAGAHVAMMASALLENGVDHFAKVLTGLTQWMETHEYGSIRQMRGSMALRSITDTATFERANYVRVLSSSALRMPDKKSGINN